MRPLHLSLPAREGALLSIDARQSIELRIVSSAEDRSGSSG